MDDAQAQVTQNTFCTYIGSPDKTETTIFFVSGNPGLIGYYHPFLSLLVEYLKGRSGDLDSGSASYQIYGCSLGGFEVEADDHVDGRMSAPSEFGSGSRGHAEKNHANRVTGGRLYDLEDQIRFVRAKLAALMNETNSGAHGSLRKRKVILMGHSVGAYIAMEVARRHRDASSGVHSHLHSDSKESNTANAIDFDIVGGVMLFPTVIDIAHSPSGQKLTTLLSLIPHLALVASFLARVLTTLFPATVLQTLIRTFMKDPPKHALDATYTFLTSSGGVRQAIHMAADEMRTITSDKWTDDIWGVATAKEPITKMFFYFGRNDHWVAEKTRDQILQCRDGTGPRMFVCEEGLPHAFCLKHSDIMARKVAGMIREIGCS